MRNFNLAIGEQVLKTGLIETIRSPFNGDEVGQVTFAGPEEIGLAVKAVDQAFADFARIPSYERAIILQNISAGLIERKEELAELIRDEAGKPVSLARIEVERASTTFSIAAEETKRVDGDVLNMDSASHGLGRTGLVCRFPIGPILGITPFNFPLNLAAHKVGPALAAGNTVVLKPSSQAPMSALLLSEIALKAGLPPGALVVIPCSSQLAETMATDNGFKMLTFTGSADVGWKLKSLAGRKRVTLELGGNAAAIVEPDADMDTAIGRMAPAAFLYAGQVCISLQRIYVHRSISSEFKEGFADYVNRHVIFGDPRDPEVICGPVIDSKSADLIERWIEEARGGGAELLCGGAREGNLIQPTVLTDAADDLSIVRREVFGPVVVIDTYDSYDEALGKVNNSEYGLQAGVFTNDIRKLMKAFRTLEVGAVVHNDAPTFRIDAMPYGGTKASGFGREGVKYAIEEMTEIKMLIVRE